MGPHESWRPLGSTAACQAVGLEGSARPSRAELDSGQLLADDADATTARRNRVLCAGFLRARRAAGGEEVAEFSSEEDFGLFGKLRILPA